MSNTSLPLPPLDGERALLKSFARHLLTTPNSAGYNPINGTLILTTERLIFEPDAPATSTQRIMNSAAGARLVTFPIRRVTACDEQPRRVQWGNPNVLKAEFDNGGREYFVIHAGAQSPVGTWAEALLRARSDARDLPYDATPALSPGLEQRAGRSVPRFALYWMLGAVALCFVCSVVALFANRLG